MLDIKIIKNYTNDGVALIKSVFSYDEICELRASSFLVLTKLNQITNSGYKHNPIEFSNNINYPSPALIFWPSLASEVLDKFRRDKRIANIVYQILGENIKQLNNQIYFRLPGDADEFNWHQDIMFRTPLENYPNIVEKNAYLQTAIVVDEMTEENGPIIFALGSHKLGNLKLLDWNNPIKFRKLDESSGFNDRFPGCKLKFFNAKPGDVLIWSALTVHGSSANRSLLSRMYYMNGFASSECSLPYPEYMYKGQVVAIDPLKIP